MESERLHIFCFFMNQMSSKTQIFTIYNLYEEVIFVHFPFIFLLLLVFELLFHGVRVFIFVHFVFDQGELSHRVLLRFKCICQ